MGRYRAPRSVVSVKDYHKLYQKYYKEFKGPVFDNPDFIREYREMYKDEIETYETETGNTYKRGKGAPPRWEQMARVKPILKKKEGKFYVDLT